MKKTFTGTPFCAIWWVESSIAGGLKGSCEKWFPAVFQEVVRTLEEVYYTQGNYIEGECVSVLWPNQGKNFYNLCPNLWIILRIFSNRNRLFRFIIMFTFSTDVRLFLFTEIVLSVLKWVFLQVAHSLLLRSLTIQSLVYSSTLDKHKVSNDNSRTNNWMPANYRTVWCAYQMTNLHFNKESKNKFNIGNMITIVTLIKSSLPLFCFKVKTKGAKWCTKNLD